MKVIVLSDNRSVSPDYPTEHGLSVYVETSTSRYLLDTGASDLFLLNAVKAGVDLQLVDWVIISHGHCDHTGGLHAFLKLNSKAKVLIADGALSGSFFSIRKGFRSIGTNIDLSDFADRFVVVDKSGGHENYWLNDEAVAFRVAHLPYPTPLANKTLFKGSEEELVLDNFEHELVWVLGKTNPFVFTGCAHKGLLNIVEAVRSRLHIEPAIVFGGFHLVEKLPDVPYETNEMLEKLASTLESNYAATRFFTGHCTGDAALHFLLKRLPGQVQQFGVGGSYIF